LTGRFVRSVGQSSLLVCVDHCLVIRIHICEWSYGDQHLHTFSF